MPCWVPVPCCVLLNSFTAVPGAGAVVVVDVEVALTGKTGLVEVFACVLTNALGGIAAWPEPIASALVLSVVGSCGPTPVRPVAAAVAILFCTAGATLMVFWMTIVLWMLLKMMLFGGGAT
jgi:hypothetical protein